LYDNHTNLNPEFHPVSIQRRQILQAASATAFSVTVPGAIARAPMANAQVMSVHRMKVGNFEVTTILDGFIEADPRLLNASQDMVKSLLEAAQLPYGPVRIPVNTFLVNTGEKLVLIDTGGARMIGPNAGKLSQGLAAAGVALDQIDEVYITHMHGDHLHGAVTPEGAALFPNAVLRVGKPDVDFWTSAENEAAAPPEQRARFGAAKRAKAAYGDRLKPFALGEELTPGIRSVPAVGHTPGHSCYLIQSGTAKLLAIGDLIHIAPVQFKHPEVTIAFDWQQPTARGARQEIFDMVARENIAIAAVHLPFPGVGQLRKEGAGYVYTPMSWRLF
jgi:glyoxylase-like metal-dependent hydrolase (beta-lactamase superfamily II)